nr:phage tail tape measure protein [Allopusillimonas soli]
MSSAQAATVDFARQSESALSRASVATTRYGRSQKELSMAMRGVPAQITDIVTSLQAGQRPMSVLLQQGGQLKDMFGGIAPAARALGSTLISLINPLTIVAGGAALLAAAYISGEKESQALQKALITTGHYAGITADQLAEMAERVGKTAGTTGKAAEALVKVVSSGKIAGSAIEQVGLAAIAMEDATGQAIKKTIDQFESLADSPSDAIVKLNSQYHFLTAAVYEQITALEDQGRKDDAAALAQRTYASAVQQRAQEVQESVGYMERAWSSLKGVVVGAWDAMKDVGRTTTAQEELAKIDAEIAKREGGFDLTGRLAKLKSRREGLRDLIKWRDAAARARADDIRAQNLAISAEDTILKLREQSASKTDKLNKALKDYRDNLKAIRALNPAKDSELYKKFLDPAKIAADEAAIRNKFKESGSSGSHDDAATKLLQRLRQSETVTMAQLASEQKLTSAQQERLKYEQLFADLKEKKVLTTDQKSLLLNESLIRAQLDRNVAAEQELRTKKEAVKVDALRASLAASLAADQQQYEEQLAGAGLGKQAQDELRARQKIMRDYQRDLKRASQGFLEGDIGKQTYERQIELLQENLDERLALQRQYYLDLRQEQAEWRNGATAGLADYLDATRDVASQTKTLFTDAFKGMEDAITTFVTTGKLSFSEFADSVINDMVRMAVQQNITGPLAQAASNVLGNLFGGQSAPSGVTPGVDWVYKNATGNVYAGPSISAYSNTVVDKPTFFARGGNVMGEAGPEAILPLKRGPDGNLGVRAVAGQNAAPNVKINIINQGGERMQGQTTAPKFDGEQWVIDVWLKKARTSGAFRSEIRGVLA